MLLISTGLSVLFHLLILWLAYIFPSASPPREEVMTVDLADLPRSTNFLPPKAGVLEGRRPRPAPAPPAKPKTEPRPKPKAERKPPREMTGRVPDLPVNPALPPEESFSPPRPKQQTPAPQAKAAPEAGEGSAPAAKPETSPPAGSGSPEPSIPSGSLRDLTPSLGRMVMARTEPPGGRGKGVGTGEAVGTGTKPSGKEGVTEGGGSGFRLTPLNAPEVQYISYFASIKRKIELVWQYPYDAAVAGIQGECMIEFVIGRSGKLESVELIQGSGYKVLDDEALRSIRKASPFDPIPADYQIPRLEIRGRFVYINGGALRVR